MSDFISGHQQHASVSLADLDEPRVSCPFAKAAPSKFVLSPACGRRMPWPKLSGMVRHHTIASHERHNQKLLEEGDADAINPAVFADLRLWYQTKKKWKSQQDRIDRWNEVFDIIVRRLGIIAPDGLDPEWTTEWALKALDGGRLHETIQRRIVSEDIRHEATALVAKINDTKSHHYQFLRSLFQIQQTLDVAVLQVRNDIDAAIFRHEQNLSDLKTLLRQKVGHECADEFLEHTEHNEDTALVNAGSFELPDFMNYAEQASFGPMPPVPLTTSSWAPTISHTFGPLRTNTTRSTQSQNSVSSEDGTDDTNISQSN